MRSPASTAGSLVCCLPAGEIIKDLGCFSARTAAGVFFARTTHRTAQRRSLSRTSQRVGFWLAQGRVLRRQDSIRCLCTCSVYAPSSRGPSLYALSSRPLALPPSLLPSCPPVNAAQSSQGQHLRAYSQLTHSPSPCFRSVCPLSPTRLNPIARLARRLPRPLENALTALAANHEARTVRAPC